MSIHFRRRIYTSPLPASLFTIISFFLHHFFALYTQQQIAERQLFVLYFGLTRIPQQSRDRGIPPQSVDLRDSQYLYDIYIYIEFCFVYTIYYSTTKTTKKKN